MNAPARVLHARLHLLDRQVVSRDEDRLLCKVDDLEVRMGDGPFPYVTAILSGPLALGPRFGGVLGWLIVRVSVLFHAEERPAPYRIDMSRVTEIGGAVRVAGEPEDLVLERWLAANIIGRIPGALAAGAAAQGPVRRRGHDLAVGEARERRTPAREVHEREAGAGGLSVPETGAGPRTVRMSALLARVVRDDSGNVVGNVVDVRLVQDGPVLGGTQRAFRLGGLVIARRRAGQLFG